MLCLQTFEDETMFQLIGILCGLAIYNAIIVDLSFPLALYKKVLKRYDGRPSNWSFKVYLLHANRHG